MNEYIDYSAAHKTIDFNGILTGLGGTGIGIGFIKLCLSKSHRKSLFTLSRYCHHFSGGYRFVNNAFISNHAIGRYEQQNK